MVTDASGGGDDPAALAYYRPCVGVVLTDGQGRVFSAERIDLPGAWQMPQGGIDQNESPVDAAFRELEEEIGVGSDDAELLAEHPRWLTYDYPAALVADVRNGRWRGQRQRWFLLRLTGAESSIRLDTDHPEFSRWRWAEPGEVISGIVAFKRDIYEEVLSYFGPNLGSGNEGNGLSRGR